MTHAMTLAQELLACLETQLTTVSAYPVPAEKVMLRAGAEVTPLLGTGTDECCTGLGWVRIANRSGLRELGEPLNTDCFESERILVLEVGVARCAPSADHTTVPSEDQWTDAAMKLDSDMGSMEAAICCAFWDIDPVADQQLYRLVEEVAVGVYEPFGVDGNCIGGTMLVNIKMPVCCPTGD